MTIVEALPDLAPSGRLGAVRERLRGRVAPAAYAGSLAFWASSWHLRLSVLMAWMPIEPVRLASLMVALCVVHRFGRTVSLPTAVAGPLVMVLIGFLPGALRASGEGYGGHKVATMVFVLLPIVLASIVLLDSRAARRSWLGAQVFVGVAVAVASVTTSHVSATQPGRFTLATVDTISTARLVGAATVVLVLLAMTAWRHVWWAIPVAVGCGAVMVQVGSRGPILFVLVSVLVVALAGRCFARRRALLAVVMIGFAVAIYRYAVADGGTGGQRLLSEGLADAGRSELLSDAIRAGTAHPFGVGWGDFATYSQAARQIANAQGVSYAHDAFAEAFSEGGWLALIAFTAFVVIAMVRLWRLSDRPLDAVLWGTAVYWFCNALVSLDFVGNRFMWISLVCGLAVTYSGRDVGSAGSAAGATATPAARRTLS